MAMEPNLLKYIWKHSRSDQIFILMVILASMPTYFLSLELPKRIVNGPIQGVGFENPGDVATFLRTSLPIPEWIYSGPPIVIFPGFELERVAFLMALSFSFLALVTINGLFKLYINTFKGRMGERLLRRLRFELFDRVLRYPMSRFRRTKASEVASMIKDEVEPMGEFIGDAYTMPLFEGGQAATALLFIFLQNVWLGLLTVVIIAFQAWLIPILRRPIIKLGKQRQVEARRLAGRLGEVVDGISDMHVNDTSNLERADISSNLGRLFFIRFELFQRKFSVKFLNNFLLLFLQFLFYALGGYLAVRGTIDIGQLVAVIAAFKDLPGPVRGLINWDQKRLVVNARYTQVVEQFAADDLMESKLQVTAEEPVGRIGKGFEIANLVVKDDTGSTLIEKATADIGRDEQLAIVGPVGGGAAEFAQVLARLTPPTAGRVVLDERDINELPENYTGRRMAYIDSNPYFPEGAILECLTYVLKNQPVRAVERDPSAASEYRKFIYEARRADNSDLDIDAEWIDYGALGIESDEQLMEQVREVLQFVGMEDEIRSYGLRGTIDPETHPELCEQLVEARSAFRSRLKELKFDAFVEPFEPDTYNNQSTIGENLLFGTAIAPAFEPNQLSSNALVRTILREEGLEDVLFEMGKEVASTTVELFGDLSSDNPFFDQLNYMEPEDIPEYRVALARIGEAKVADVAPADQELILRLPFAYTEAKNRLGLLDDGMKARIVEMRGKLREALSDLETAPVAFYDPEQYNRAASVLDNVLLGRVASNVAEGPERVFEAISNLLGEMGLTDEIFAIGLEFNVGTGGKRLSESQRQKLHLARALLKKPDILIVNQALNTLDARNQKSLLEAVLDRAKADEYGGFGVIWVPMNPALSQAFERVLLFKDGELVADDTPSNLSKDNETYRALLDG